MNRTYLLGLLALCLLPTLFSARTSAETKPSLSYSFSKEKRDTAPVALTTDDGTGLKLKLYQAKTVIEGPLAFTELRLTFVNPENRVREGHFEISLPDQAAISRFAMRIEDVWQEAEVVERQAARRAYEDFLHRRQDPALLENEAGNEFRARIFPIPAKGEKELILSYSQELPSATTPYTLNLQGLPEIEDFEIDIRITGSDEGVKLQRKNFQAQGDFVLKGLNTANTLAGGDYVVTRVKPSLDSTEDALEDLLILVDSSASRSLGFEAQQNIIRNLAASLPESSKLSVVAFDQDLETIYQGSSQKLDLSKLQSRGAFGATDLQKTLKWAAAHGKHKRLVLLTDGITTAGPSQLAGALRGSSLKRLDVVLVGGIRDLDKMRLLVEESLGREGVVVSGELPVAEITEKLKRSVVSGLDVELPGAEWVWPTTLDNVQPGDARLVYAKLKAGAREPLKLRVGAQSIELSPTRAEFSPLLTRAAATAQIARLESQLSETEDPQQQEALTKQIIEWSIQNRVLSSKTALLVLETDADYERFQIDRKALSDILVVGPSGLSLENRSNFYLSQASTTPKSKDANEESDFDGAPPSVGSDGPPSDDARMESAASTASPRERRAESPQAEPASSSPPPSPRSDDSVARPEPVVSRALSHPIDAESEVEENVEAKKQSSPPPLDGKYSEIDELIKKNRTKEALEIAQAWHQAEPGNILALIALGDCLEQLGRKAEAARVFGSIIDLFPSRADLRRYAGSRLQKLRGSALELAVDSFGKAVEQRPDHVSSHRFLAFALARAKRYEQAMEALEAGLSRKYPEGRFRSYDRILKEDLGLIGAAWLSAKPDKKNEIYARLKKYDTSMADEPSLRFILTWETDANDVDFHIKDNSGGHAYYSNPQLPSGGELYGDVTTGYGPECFAITGPALAYPYSLQLHYYSRGPMGYGMGQLEILEHDGKGGLRFEERPYVVMTDGAYVDLGSVER